MSVRPRLVPAAPTRGPELPVAATPFWVGTAPDSGLRLFLPGISERHVSILEREDGFWVSASRAEAAPRVNGAEAPHPRRLRNGDLLEFAPGVVYRFDTGEAVRPAAPPPAPQPPRGLATAAPATPAAPRRRQGGLVDRKTRRGRWLRWTAIGAAVALVLAAVGVVVYGLRHDEGAVTPLSEADAAHVDSLMLVSYERVERGTALLELGLADDALKEFAGAVNTLEASRLGENRWVRPRIANLEAAIAAVYRAKRVAVPPRYRAAPPADGTAPAVVAPRGSLSVAEFAAGVEAVQREFQARYGRTLVVTGADHDEHVALYGRGGALDLRTRDLSREQVLFAVRGFRARGIRVKDFSDDDVLQRQIASARAAGLLDRAGTGLHLHIDRFADRRDRWTVE